MQVLERDNYRCQIRLASCRVAATQVDHIRPVHLFPDLVLEPGNCRAACGHCNAVLGARFGNALRARRSQVKKRAAVGYSARGEYWG